MVRHQKAVCSTCRRRKSKCDGALPRCSACAASSSTCHYEKAPSIAYVRSLQTRIHDLESKLKDSDGNSSLVAPALPTSAFNNEEDSSISLNAQGDVIYHNQTSAIHEDPPILPNQSHNSASPTLTQSATEISTADTRHRLVANAAAQKNLELLNLSASPRADIPSEVSSVLMKLHWCWLHPSFLFVYRPAFTRDLLQTPHLDHATTYCSATLFKVMCAHSCRFIQNPEGIWSPGPRNESFKQLSSRLMSEAKVLLAMETVNRPSIPTIQALLQQSAHDIACGHSSSSWLYSGMAFRMAIDLGLHVSPDVLQRHSKTLSTEDVEIRKRLFWSLYAWDKHISLYLGRMPNFTSGSDNVSLNFLDDFTDEDPWEPFYESDSSQGDLPSYPPVSGHVVSCFKQLCKLCTIISQVMLKLYSPESAFNSQPSTNTRGVAFVEIDRKLHAWYSDLPCFLQIPPDRTAGLSPPPHITSLHLMYNSTLILLHRPLASSAHSVSSDAARQSWKVCRAATTTIYQLLRMYIMTFGFQHITYMNSYCTYTAATTAVYQLETSDDGSQFGDSNQEVWTELRFLLDILQRTSSAMPGLNRSIDIIRTRIKRILDRQAARQLDLLFPASAQPTGTRATVEPSNMQRTQDDAVLPHNQLESPVGDRHFEFPEGPEGLIGDPKDLDLWLPAFPGQDISYGSDVMLDMRDVITPETRSALMGSNLDPHMQLDASMQHYLPFEYENFAEGTFGSSGC